jgi:2-aminobenzoate-CoA ligase
MQHACGLREHLAWPFFDAGHRTLAADLEAWARRNLGAAEHDDVGAECRSLVASLGRAGWLRACVPARDGGLREALDARSLCISREILAYHEPLADFAFAMQGLGSGPISLAGSPEQRERYLPRVVAGTALAAFALSEPNAGSDAAAIEAAATRDGSGYVLHGEKTWISNGGVADFYVVFARTGEAPGSRGISAFVIDADAPGLHVTGRIETIAPHPLASLRFEGVRAGQDCLLGTPGEGFRLAMRTLDVFRTSVAAAALGFARRALDAAVDHASARRMFGQRLLDFQLTHAALADMATAVDTSALLTYRAAWTRDVAGGRATREAAMAKLVATESAQATIDRAVQLFGALGVTRGNVAERLYREVRALRIYEGASEVQRMVIARETIAGHGRAVAGGERMAGTTLVDTFVRDHLPPPDQWPELRFDLPELQYPRRLNCVVELLDRHVAGGFGARRAVVTPALSLTYAGLLERVNRYAHVLRDDLGLIAGNRVLIRGYNNATTAALWLAVVKAGYVAVTTMPMLRAKEITDVATLARVDAVVCDRRLAADLASAAERCRYLTRVIYSHDDAPEGLDVRAARQPTTFEAADCAADDPCMIAFTSGTTGRPKGTVHFHRDILAACDTFPPSSFGAHREDLFCGTPPLAFTFGLGQLLLFPLRAGAATLLVEAPAPDALLAAIAEYGATICAAAPTAYRAMAPLAAKYDLHSLRACVSAGETLPVATRTLWRDATGIDIIDGIGSTEMLHIFLAASGADIRPGATGKPVPGYVARVQDDDGNPVPVGAVGRLAVQGPTGCRYLDDPRQTQYVRDGWNLTGDAYSMDEDGYFWYQARTDDMIISSGYNIAGPEIEGALLMHPAVAECAVVGLPDEERGQVVSAFVLLRDGVTGDDRLASELQDFVKAQIAPYKYPRRVVFVDTLPRTETGKLQRFKLRAQTAAAS